MVSVGYSCQLPAAPQLVRRRVLFSNPNATYEQSSNSSRSVTVPTVRPVRERFRNCPAVECDSAGSVIVLPTHRVLLRPPVSHFSARLAHLFGRFRLPPSIIFE